MDAYARFLDSRRFGSLDGLRCVAILYVVLLHSPVDIGLASRGQMGVHLFFAISGFLITSLMIRERMKTGSISMAGFYLRRTLRIFPLYYAVLAVYVVAVLVLDQGEDGAEFFRNLPFFLTYTSNWFVQGDGRVIFLFAWSLATEEQFYLTWPWVERYAEHRTKIMVLAALAGLAAANHFGLLPIDRDSLAYAMLWSVAPAIVFGVGVAHLLHSRSGFALAWKLIGHKASAPLAMLFTVAALTIPPGGQAVEYLCYASLTALVASCVIREDNGLAKLLQLRPLVRIGVVSYGIYLMHQLAFFAVESVIANRWAVLVVTILLVWAAAEISFATFERFFLRLKPGHPVPQPAH